MWWNRFVLVLTISLPAVARGNLVIYQLPGTDLQIVLEGSAKMVPGRLIEYNHPVFKQLMLSTENARIIEAPTKRQLYAQMANKAKGANTVEAYLDAARFALKNGMLKEFNACASEAWKINKDDPTVKRLVQTKLNINKKLSSPDATIATLRDMVGRPDMKVNVSDHYVVLHDVPDNAEKVGRKKIPRAEARLQLLETVYELYFQKFALDGIVLEPPKEHLMVLLFNHEDDYLHYATRLDPDLKQASGFWSSKDNVAVFYDQGTSEEFQALNALSRAMQEAKKELKGVRTDGTRDFHQLANALDLLIQIAKEEADIEVVSHEATHQLAGNTSLIPRGAYFLRWAQEGLATYFETPSGAGWGGIGAVNTDRLRWYRRLAADTEHSTVEFIVTDKIFDYAATHAATVAAYGQSWGLTHFLMEKHPEKLAEYYKKVGEKIELGSRIEESEFRNQCLAIFEEIFGDTATVNAQWKAYMRGLKTDTEVIIEKYAKRK